jgi:hypothetical protein
MMTLFLSALGQEVIHHWPSTVWFAALQDKDVDVIYQVQSAFNTFIKSGQAWALVIGFVFGYLFRGLTSY